jgi:hypothetical protein
VKSAVKTFLVFAFFAVITCSAAIPSLGTCSVRYGNLMVSHWLTVDLLRQIERGLFYQQPTETSNLRAEFDKLQHSVDAVEQQLDRALALYRSLSATNSAEGLLQLSELLDHAAEAENVNDLIATGLLKSLGELQGRAGFNPLPISKADLAPAWLPANANNRSRGEQSEMFDKNFHPRRILFGCTGRAADDRTLPLDFDFGSGVYGFYVPMASSNKLDISPGLADHSDPLFKWMQTHHSGYHFWAGVYNNQNTYVAPWFLKDHKTNPDVWMKLADGKVLPAGDWSQVNIWNPRVRQYIQTYCETQSRTFRDDPYLVCYDYTGEPHPWGGQAPGQAQYSGYNDSAIAAFQAYLREKFGSIAKLNRAWRTNYSAFSVIQPPPDPYLTTGSKATPLNYEFERFRCDSHTRYWKLVYDAYRKHDKTKPIEANAGMYMSGWPVEGLHAYQLQKTGVADWVDMHMNNFPPNLPEQIYLYSLCRLSGKVPVEFEYIWTFPRTGPVGETNESDFRATCEASVWRNLVWGKKVLVFFDFYYDWPAYHNAFFDQSLGYSILRPSGSVVPVTKRKALRYNDILMNTEVATPPIIILEPTTSILNSPPLHPNQSFSYHTGVAVHDVHDLLFPKSYPFLYVPEQAVLDGYSLNQHKVIILPQAPCFPAGLTERLLAWVKRGGTLISVGPPGIWDAYGHDDGRLLNQVFGPSNVRDTQPGKWKWEWRFTAHPLLGERAGVRANLPQSIWKTNEASGNTLAALASYGKGKVLVTTAHFDTPELQTQLYRALDTAIGVRPAACAENRFELVLREDKRGHRYLFVLNPHTRDIREDDITVSGRYPHCTDLGIGSGLPLLVSAAASQTTFHIRLHPGEGTVVALQ